jgi:signal transduction histidine kinase
MQVLRHVIENALKFSRPDSPVTGRAKRTED